MNKTTETAFESYVEEILLITGCWTSDTNAEWDKERAQIPAQVFAFIEETRSRREEVMKFRGSRPEGFSSSNWKKMQVSAGHGGNKIRAIIL